MPKVVNAALKTKAWTFEAKAIKFGLKTYNPTSLVNLYLNCFFSVRLSLMLMKVGLNDSWAKR